ncbi:MAG: hypothetical protein IME96_05865 [Proteobacteria bacterium]|nr:hypothetical protein [Pseudomonadota bacterium]
MSIQLENTDYPLIQIETPGDWKHVVSACDGYLAERDFSKLSSYFADDIKTVIVEKKYNDKDFRGTYYNFYAKKFANYPNNTIRLHFFSATISADELFNLDNHSDSYIGFSVIRPTKINPIGRTILDPQRYQALRDISALRNIRPIFSALN